MKITYESINFSNFCIIFTAPEATRQSKGKDRELADKVCINKKYATNERGKY